MKDLHIHLRVRILLWACSRSCGFGCLGRAEGSLQFRGNVLTDGSRSAPLSPGCSMLEGTDRHQLSGASHSRLSDGLYFRACPSLHLTQWNPEFLMCSDPSCHSSVFSTRLSVCPKSRGERETLGAGNMEVGVESYVIGDLYRCLSSDTHGQLSVFGDSWEFSGLIGILEFPRSNSKQ